MQLESSGKFHWYRVPLLEAVPRFGHQLVMDDAGDRLFAVGGFITDLDKSVASIQEIRTLTDSDQK